MTAPIIINWESNVFPGILGRTCDRPCEPACRRGRLQEEPVAICRLKRVAADRKSDITDRLPKAPAQRNGKRVGCVGAGPASLTVARDLAAIGYEVVVFDSDSQAGGMMRSQIPKFRLPDEVIDEEVGYALSTGGAFVASRRIESLKAMMAEGFDAIFIGCGAPRGRDLDAPGRREAARTFTSASTGSRACRSAIRLRSETGSSCSAAATRRWTAAAPRSELGGGDVKVVVRSGFAEMKASPWEKEDAMHEGVAILNYLVPKAFTHERGRLTGVAFEKVAAEKDDRGRRVLVPTGEPDVHIECDDVLVAVGQENAFPWIETDAGLAFGKDGLPAIDPVTFQSSLPSVFFGGDAALGPEEHHHRSGARPRGGDFHRRLLPRRGPRVRPAPMTNLVSTKMGLHEWSYDNAITLDRRFAVPQVEKRQSVEERKTEVELEFTDQQALAEARRCLNCDIETVFSPPACIECDACVDICPMDCISFVPNAPEEELRRSLSAPALNLTQAIYVSEPVKTGRIMAKDEDLCLHCGLCAERCPTGAWDMRKFTIEMAQAGRACQSTL